MSGAQALALLLFVTNFAWIALNNVIAASISARRDGRRHAGVWATALGLVATLIVLGGPRAAALVDRVAVPLLLRLGRCVHGGLSQSAMARRGRPARSPPATSYGGSTS